MSSITTHQEADISITVKNTFLDFKRQLEVPARRSSSVPRAFKLWDSQGVDAPDDDDSTSASGNSGSARDYPDYCSECTNDEDFVHPGVLTLEDAFECRSCSDLSLEDSTSADGKSKVTLSLDDMVADGAEKVRAKLRSQAKPFKSIMPPANREVADVIQRAVEVLRSIGSIVDVQVQDGGMGGTTMIVAKSSSTAPDAAVAFSLVKDALLSAALLSESTYILGYGAQPFNNLGPLSFSATIASVPDAQKNTACWETYEKGFCPRCSSCHWGHPSGANTMRTIFVVERSA